MTWQTTIIGQLSPLRDGLAQRLFSALQRSSAPLLRRLVLAPMSKHELGERRTKYNRSPCLGHRIHTPLVKIAEVGRYWMAARQLQSEDGHVPWWDRIRLPMPSSRSSCSQRPPHLLQPIWLKLVANDPVGWTSHRLTDWENGGRLG
jgi:hypothetical protein